MKVELVTPKGEVLGVFEREGQYLTTRDARAKDRCLCVVDIEMLHLTIREIPEPVTFEEHVVTRIDGFKSQQGCILAGLQFKAAMKPSAYEYVCMEIK